MKNINSAGQNINTSGFMVAPGRILVQPIVAESFLQNDNNNFEEMGIVLQIGQGCTKFLSIGDTVFFIKEASEKTPEVNGEQFYVVLESPEFILGKISNAKGK